MGAKTGRNDPCPCGSGRKFKHCCGSVEAMRVVDESGHAGAVERALAWLESRYRKAAGAAIQTMLFAGLTEAERLELKSQEDETWQAIELNANEWLLAEASIDVRGEPTRVRDLLLGNGGPLFTAGQRQWIEQLCERPLRLYEVTGVVPGRQMTLCDALDTDAPPIIVAERAASQASLVGSMVGFRVMQSGDRRELSGAAFPFSRLAGSRAVAAMREAQTLDAPMLSPGVSTIIWRHWLAQFLTAPSTPTVVDAATGELLLFVTDHYRVRDWTALAEALSAQHDVEGDREAGWTRLDRSIGDARRPIASINVGKVADRISVFYRTRGHADRGRRWFESLARGAVQFISRELSDPKGALAGKPGQRSHQRHRAEDARPPEIMAEIVEKVIHQSYANWPDEPIPALGGKTTRQAIRTVAGLERVKGLLRGYQANEGRQAQRDGRPEISYAFLWKALGIGDPE